MYDNVEEKLKDKLQYLCRQFRIPGEIILSRRIPNGHINDAYYAAVYDGKEVKQFLIQRVNTFVFRDPISMMHNIDLITQHIMDKEPTQERRRRLHFRHTEAGHNYVILKSGAAVEPEDIEVDWANPGDVEFWRLYNFIESSTSFETSEGNAEVLRMSGKAFVMLAMASAAAAVRKVTSAQGRPPSQSACASGTASAASSMAITGTMPIRDSCFKMSIGFSSFVM